MQFFMMIVLSFNIIVAIVIYKIGINITKKELV